MNAAALKPGQLNALLDAHALDAPFTRAEEQQLEGAARRRLAQFAREWGKGGLAEKLNTLRKAPTQEMKDAVNKLLRGVFPDSTDDTFDLWKVESPHLRDVMLKVAVVKFASARGELKLYGITDTDWNGKPFTEMPVASQAASDAQRALAKNALRQAGELQKSGAVAKFSAQQAQLFASARNELKALSIGSIIDFGFGGDDNLSLTGAASFSSDMAMAAMPDQGIYEDPADERYTIDLLARTVSPHLGRINAGTIQSAEQFALPGSGDVDGAKATLGDPAEVPAAKRFVLAYQLLMQRAKEAPTAQQPGYSLAEAPLKDFLGWEAENKVPAEDVMTFAGLRKTIDTLLDQKTVLYKQRAMDAVDAVFKGPDALTPEERTKVAAAVAAQTTFGGIKAALLGALVPDRAGTFQKALDGLGAFGGDTADQAAAQDQFVKQVVQPVQSWFTNVMLPTYAPKSNVDPVQLFDPAAFKLNFDADTSNTDMKGVTQYGAAAPRSTPRWIREVLHEFTHRLQRLRAQGSAVTGMGVEGGAFFDENTLTDSAFAAIYPDPTQRALAQFSLIDTDMRFAARTEATLTALSNPGEDAIGMIRNEVLPAWGITDPKLQDAAQNRAFNGDQYLGYLGAYTFEQQTLATLKQKAELPADFPLSPMILELWGVDTSTPSDQAAASVKAAYQAQLGGKA
jgi:hypothetical protein